MKKTFLFLLVSFLASCGHQNMPEKRITFGDIKVFDHEHDRVVDNAVLCFKYFDQLTPTSCEEHCVTIDGNKKGHEATQIFLNLPAGRVVLDSLAVINKSELTGATRPLDAKFHFTEGVGFNVDPRSKGTYFGNLYIYLNVPNKHHLFDNKLVMEVQDIPSPLLMNLPKHVYSIKDRKNFQYTASFIDTKRVSYQGVAYSPLGKFYYYNQAERGL